MRPDSAFDMTAIIQAAVQAAVKETINNVAHLQTQRAAAMPVTGVGETA